MKTRSLAALATIRARIARRRRASAVAHEREIRPPSDRSGAPPTEVRALFVAEFARLKIGAKIGSYLSVLTQSNVRGMLRRKTLAAEAAARTKASRSSRQ
jgi:hypothetical protein